MDSRGNLHFLKGETEQQQEAELAALRKQHGLLASISRECLTEKQLSEKKVSLHDTRSPAGKKLQKLRKGFSRRPKTKNFK